MIVVSAGSFQMGSPEDEISRQSDEGPQHLVTIEAPFAIGRFEVTYSQWDTCVLSGGYSYVPQDRDWGRDNRPVLYISWKNTREYLGWLNQRTGQRYRLPSEAEWEYAARGGTTTAYWWGSEIGWNNANCLGCGNIAEHMTVPVGSFAPNPFGLYEVHGNVWEWTEDCWHGSYAGAPQDGSSWSIGDCESRVLRGGSWGIEAADLRAARRIANSTTLRSGKRGFRVVMTLPGPDH